MNEEGTSPEKFIKLYRKSEVIFGENSTGEEMYIVCSGKVQLYSKHQNGRRAVLAVLKPGEHFGEMALVDRSPRSATAVAMHDNTALVVLDKPKFLYLVQQQPDFAFTIMETLSKRIRETNTQLAQARAKRRRA
jgi:CRP/FNR family transcriptional regulator, cyclic AMP receptor protein